ncbi:MAG TPA: hypothetical protein VHG69_12545, partial [Thermoleophilaceae bacterium]|nr:hypothetical protein [Thermoleophilaceae bacterium]
DPALGKGYGEALILDHFIDNVLSGEHGYERVVKCNGRLFVENAEAIVAHLRADTDVACALDGALTWADSRFLVARAATFASLLHGLAGEIDERRGVYLEHVLMRRIAAAIGAGARWRPLPAVPRYSGTGATGDRPYDGVRERARWILHSALRTLRYRPRSPV